jgi:lipopolysaccharide/colanic/teichoic acid biosynthesis glycosyltransferase
MLKFRSMVVNAEELKGKLAYHNQMVGPVFKIKNDSRVTTSWRVLRKTSLDELLQWRNELS